MLSLRGKVALVTGSTSGIGLGIARALAAQGADLVLNGIEKPAAAQKVVDELTAAFPGVGVAFSGADLTDASQVDDMMTVGPRSFSGRPVSILVNNAGIQHVASGEDFSLEVRWSRLATIIQI